MHLMTAASYAFFKSSSSALESLGQMHKETIRLFFFAQRKVRTFLEYFIPSYRLLFWLALGPVRMFPMPFTCCFDVYSPSAGAGFPRVLRAPGNTLHVFPKLNFFFYSALISRTETTSSILPVFKPFLAYGHWAPSGVFGFFWCSVRSI